MTREILVTTLGQIPIGEGRVFLLDEGEIAVFHTHDGGVHATQPYCPHLGGPLADGLTGGTTVVCPLHDRIFDLATGCGLSHELMDIKVFASRLDEQGNIWVVPDSVPPRTAIYVGADAHSLASVESMEDVGTE